MELLLIFALIIFPRANASDLSRFEKRAGGYDQYLEDVEREEAKRLAEAQIMKVQRQRQVEKYETIRDTFKRPSTERDPRIKKAYLAQERLRLMEERRKQLAFAQEHHQELNLIEPQANVLKPREYGLPKAAK